MELQCLKRKKPSQPLAHRAIMGSASGSCSPREGVFGLSPPAPAPRHGCKRRLYFRCSYREDRHCLASKLVQQVTHDDPPLYEVTYKHEHTCNAAPVPAPDIEADAMAPDTSSDAALVLRFGSSGDGGGNHHRGTAMPLQERQQYHRPVLHPSPFMMLNNFDDSNSSQMHAFFPSHFVAPAGSSSCPPFPIIESSPAPPSTASWSPSYPIIESSPAAPSTDNEGDMFPTTLDWDLFIYDLEDHSHFSGDQGQFPGNTFSCETSDGSPLAHLRKGIIAEGLF